VIGYLHIASPEPYAAMMAAFRQGLKEAGYFEGQNVATEYRWAEGRPEQLPTLAAELVTKKVAVLVTGGCDLPPRAARRSDGRFANGFLFGCKKQSKEEKPMSKKIMTAAIAATLLGLATIAVTSGQAQAEKRTFTVAAVEMKGGVTVDKEPFPTDALPAGAGYVLNKPDQTGRWEVSVYMWTPSQIIVNQDDDVTLEFVGINGANHPTTIAGYDKSFVLKRGQATKISFKADKAGLFAIQCGTHKPSMAAELVVLPRK